MRGSRPAPDVLAPRPVNFVNSLFADIGLDVFHRHLVYRVVDRTPHVVGIGDRDVEGIAHDIDRPGGHGKIDDRMAAVDHERVVSLDEDSPAVHPVGDEFVHLGPGRGDFRALVVARRESEHLGIIFLAEVPGRKPVHRIDVLLALLAGLDLGEVVQEGSRPGVSRFREGGDPDDAGFRGGAYPRFAIQRLRLRAHGRNRTPGTALLHDRNLGRGPPKPTTNLPPMQSRIADAGRAHPFVRHNPGANRGILVTPRRKIAAQL